MDCWSQVREQNVTIIEDRSWLYVLDSLLELNIHRKHCEKKINTKPGIWMFKAPREAEKDEMKNQTLLEKEGEREKGEKDFQSESWIKHSSWSRAPCSGFHWPINSPRWPRFIVEWKHWTKKPLSIYAVLLAYFLVKCGKEISPLSYSYLLVVKNSASF